MGFIRDKLRRLTLLLFFFPRLYVGSDPIWEWINIEEWSEWKYEWSEDPFGGFLDYVQAPRYTWYKGAGDCEDYAVVIANHLYNTTDRPLSVVFVGKARRLPSHVVCCDGENVYSSGRIYRGVTVPEYIENTKYDYAIPRFIRP